MALSHRLPMDSPKKIMVDDPVPIKATVIGKTNHCQPDPKGIFIPTYGAQFEAGRSTHRKNSPQRHRLQYPLVNVYQKR